MPRYMKLKYIHKILFVDLELTCGFPEDEPEKSSRSEIIEIGIAEVDTKVLEITRTKSIIVRPVHSYITPFCEELTGHSQESVDRGTNLGKAFKTLRKSFGSTSKPWMAWGQDIVQIDEACDIQNLPFPFSDYFTDLSAMYSQMCGDNSRTSLQGALKALGLEFDGRPHSGVDDAINTARIYLEIARRVRLQGP